MNKTAKITYSITFVILLLMAILCMYLASAQSTITPISPLTNITTQNSSINIQYNLSCDTGLNCTTNYTFNGNSFIYDPILEYQFNNFSSLGENSTFIKDISGHGNDGVVIGGSNVSINPTGGVNGMGAVNFSGNYSYIKSPTIINGNMNQSTKGTIYFWVKTSNLGQAFKRIISMETAGNTGHRIFFNSQAIGMVYEGSASESTASTGNVLVADTWINIAFVYNGTNISTYVNGNKVQTITQATGIINGKNIVIGAVGDFTASNINCSLNDIIIFNRSLESTEITQLYNSRKIQFDTQNSSFFSSQILNSTLLNSTTASLIFPYSICITNSSQSSVCSSQQQVTRIPKVSQLTYSSSIFGKINPTFYGVNTHGLWGSNLSWIDTNNDGVVDTLSNQTWHQQMLLNANLGILRMDSRLRYVSISEGVYNTTAIYDNLYNMQTRENQVAWAYAHGMKVLWIVDSTPSWLANQTNGYCTVGSASSCSPTNLTKFTKVVTDVLNFYGCNSYPSTCEVEVWNEPDIQSFFLNNLTENAGNAVIRSVEYNKIYNATYLAVKANNSLIKVGGPTTGDRVNRFTILNNFLANFTNQIDFVSFHEYHSDSEVSFTTLLANDYNLIMGNCTLYGTTCPKVYFDEWNEGNQSIKNTTSNNGIYGRNIAEAYSSLLNLAPNNISLVFYQWSEAYKYSNTAYYPEYSQLWSMVSEPQLDNAIYPPYNITYQFTRYASANSNVLVSSINDSSDGLISNTSVVQGVVTDSGGGSLIITNTGNEAVNVSVTPKAGTYIDVYGQYAGTLFTTDGTKEYSNLIDSNDVEAISKANFSYNNGVWQVVNYLGEPIRDMTRDEINQYLGETRVSGTMSCSDMISAFSQYPFLIGLIGTVFLIGLAVLSVVGWMVFKPGQEVTAEGVGIFFLTLIGIGILVIIGIIAIGSICSVGII